MKKWNHPALSSVNRQNDLIRIIMYLKPEIFEDSEPIVASYKRDPDTHKLISDNNQDRRINGPLSDYGQLLEPPIEEEFNSFIDDCKFLIEETGFNIIKSERSTDSKKSEYIMVFGMNDDPCGTLIFELRLSDHPFDAKFPEQWKDEALKYLTMHNILDETATKAGINFVVEKITVGNIKDDTWDKALNRLDIKLSRMRVRIRKRLKEQNK